MCNVHRRGDEGITGIIPSASRHFGKDKCSMQIR